MHAGVRERRRQVALLAHAHPRARGRVARHRGRAEAAPRRARGRRRRRRAGPLLPVQEPRRPHAGVRRGGRRRDARRSTGRKGYEELARDEQQRDNPLDYEAGDTRRRDGHRARVGVVSARPARLGEARRRRAGPLSIGAGGRAPRRPPPRMDPIPGRDLRLSIDVELEQAIERGDAAARGGRRGGRRRADGAAARALLEAGLRPERPVRRRGQGARARGVQPPVRRPAAPDARQDDERRLPARVDDEALQRAGRARGPRASTRSTPRSARGTSSSGGASSGAATSTGRCDLHEAIARSCNVYFFHLAETVGMDRIASVAQAFGLGEKTGLGHQPGGPGPHPDAVVVRAPVPRPVPRGLHAQHGDRRGRRDA